MVDKDVEHDAPGGRSGQGPDSGLGEPQVEVPPYGDRQSGHNPEGAERSQRAFDADNAPEPGPDPVVSDEERSGTSATDTHPEPALGVGESRGGRAEDVAPDRPDTATKGESGRPAGEVDDEDAAGAGAPNG
jgi:hypothetical protein